MSYINAIEINSAEKYWPYGYIAESEANGTYPTQTGFLNYVLEARARQGFTEPVESVETFF